MSDERTPTLPAVLRASVAERLRDLHTSIPARVLKYDAVKNRAEVQPLIREVVIIDGTRQALSFAPLPDVPVLFVGAGAFRITFPLAPGDLVELLFAERSLDVWKTLGGTDVDPKDSRQFDLSDAVAIPSHLLATSVPSNPTVEDSNGNTVEFTADGIKFNGGTASVARVGDSVDASGLTVWMTAVQTAINLLAPGTFPSPPPSTAGTVAAGAAKVKA